MVPYVVGAGVSVTVVCVACVYAARLLACKSDGNAGVGSGGRCGCGECIYGWYMWCRCFV